jgi:hypothetical protein
MTLKQSVATTLISTFLANIVTHPLDMLLTRYQLVDTSK